MGVVEKSDFYLETSVLHPLVVGVPLTLVVWIYLRFAPNRILTNLSKFDWIFSVTLGSTLSRIITGSGSTLDLTRGTLSILVILLFQIGLAYSTSIFPSLTPYIRASPQVVVFRGRLMEKHMFRDAVLARDIRIGMRRGGVLELDEIEVMVLEAGGGFSLITKKMMDGMESKGIPESLKGVREYEILVNEREDRVKQIADGEIDVDLRYPAEV